MGNSRAEKAALKIHDTALQEAKKYSEEHGQSFIEEAVYGRGFKAGYIRGDGDGYNDGYKQALDEMRKEIVFMIDEIEQTTMDKENKLLAIGFLANIRNLIDEKK